MNNCWAQHMRKIIFLIFSLALVPVIVLAETECSDRPECWPEGSSMRTGLELVDERNKLDKLLAGKHDELTNLVSTGVSVNGQVMAGFGRLINALKSQQSAWLKYRADECELIGSLTGAGGTWPSTYAIECQVNLTNQRTQQVQSAIQCIEEIPKENRRFKQNECLHRLAPLTNE